MSATSTLGTITPARSRAARRRRGHVPLRFYDVAVHAVRQLTPHMTRVTFHGPDLAGFTDDGPDQRCKLFLPRPDGAAPIVPRTPDWFASLRAMPTEERPVARTYTVRAARPWRAELDIDFALHGDDAPQGVDAPQGDIGLAGEVAPAGPATRWARRARVGDRAVLWGAWAEYDPPPDAAWRLLVADDAALPATAAILERLPATAVAHVFVDIATPEACQPLPTRADATVTWVHRRSDDTPGADAGRRLVTALRAARLPAGPPYAWIAGEASAVTAMRRHLVRDRGVPPAAITFMGYWRHGGTLERSC